MMRFFLIVLMALAVAMIYGIAHDQVTVRVSLEYFTIGHPPVFATQSPTLLALGWGILATWWVGLPLGFLLATASEYGRRYPPLALGVLARLLGRLFLAMATAAVVCGVAGYLLASHGFLSLQGSLAEAIPADHHPRFLAARFAHGASYATGILGGVVVVVSAWRVRCSETRPR